MAKAHDIEDVLASIRQLVAEEAPAALVRGEARGPVGEEVGPDPLDEVAEGPDRLVLGAEHRVVELVAGDGAEDALTAGTDEPEAERWPEEDVAPALPEAHRPAPEMDPDAAPESEPEPWPTATVSVLPGAKRAAPPASSYDDAPPPAEEDDALRDLIADVVREELAGPLGERITRNVRKMVRRELRQMMSGEEFE
ncbi:hypothetical protein JQC91_10535 [Jannaschia sp. Os4]|uniref:hypothetical protein n=1 Tax=Jannaschia sp. Os4 TaxID=2807617 RepID=UPI00193A160D|nr:hypothetical protein [Jannaschia sp. Os4]MBM2576740.1 hypothetical protein [Jannaschia sp. Os4]